MKNKFIVVILILCLLVVLRPFPAGGSFSVVVMYADLETPADNYSCNQGDPIHFSSLHYGRLNHAHTGTNAETASIRAVLGYIDPTGHEAVMDRYHVEQQYSTYGSYPPSVDGSLINGTQEAPTLFDQDDSVDWVGTYETFAKTNFRINGGSEIVGAYEGYTLTAN